MAPPLVAAAIGLRTRVDGKPASRRSAAGAGTSKRRPVPGWLRGAARFDRGNRHGWTVRSFDRRDAQLMAINRRFLYAGLFLVALGGVLVAVDLTAVSTDALTNALRLWPLAWIAIGVG